MAAPAVQKHVLRSVDDCFMTVRALWFVLCGSCSVVRALCR